MPQPRKMEYWIRTSKRLPSYDEAFVGIPREDYSNPVLLRRIDDVGRYMFMLDSKYEQRARKIELIKKYCYYKKDIVYWLPLPMWPNPLDENEDFDAYKLRIQDGNLPTHILK